MTVLITINGFLEKVVNFFPWKIFFNMAVFMYGAINQFHLHFFIPGGFTKKVKNYIFSYTEQDQCFDGYSKPL